jgi:hypothetical protein
MGYGYVAVCLTGKPFPLFLYFLIQGTKQKQVERRGFVKRAKVADEPAVVIKPVPEKP